MLHKLKQRNSSGGFTIIEVMIVLAIAALILLVVLLAVPALRRSSTNTTSKNDAASVAGAINNFMSNNNGALPLDICGTGTITVSDRTGCTSSTNNESINIQAQTDVTRVTTAPTSPNPATGSIQVLLRNDCNGASSRSAAVYYVTQTGNSTSKWSCQSV